MRFPLRSSSRLPTWYWIRVVIVIAACFACARTPRDPILILISFDGWRWDYIDRASVPNLRALAARGVRSEGLIPAFPSNTFPNHYTLVTGLLPDHHGIVNNTFRDPALPERFSMSAATAKDPGWWGGEPLWTTVTKHGRRSAAMFWPGSDVEIGGERPSYWKAYDGKVSNDARVKQVLDWLALPQAERPSFITLYFSEVDTAGHDHGPESSEVLEAAAHLDRALGDLLSGIESLGLVARTSVVVVSDHGMSQQTADRTIVLDDYLDPGALDVFEWSGTLTLAPRSSSVDEIYTALKGKHPALAIYKREELPADLGYGTNPRVAPIVGLIDDGWRVTTRARIEEDRARNRMQEGAHGYDPKNRSMHGLFVAAGPNVKQGAIVTRVQSVDVYDFLCTLLELPPNQNDGDLRTSRLFLRN